MSTERVWAAGGVRSRGDLRPALGERAFRYGDGVFATLMLRNSRLLDADAHLDRLAGSTRRVGLALPDPVNTAERLAEIVSRLGAAPGTDCIVRVQVSAGPGGRGYGRCSEEETGDGPWELVELFAPPAARRLRITVLADGLVPVPALPEVKSCSALAHVLCARAATEAGVDEAIRVSGGAILEASAANVFWTSGSTLFTPSSTLPLYPGVTRAVVLAVAEAEGWTVEEGSWPPGAIAGADAVFLSNATRGVEPVTAVGDAAMGWPEAVERLRLAVSIARDEAATRLPSGSDRTGRPEKR